VCVRMFVCVDWKHWRVHSSSACVSERESERERDVKFPLIPDFMRESVCVCE